MRFPIFSRKSAQAPAPADLEAKAAPIRSAENQAAVSKESPVGKLRGRWYTLGVPLVQPDTMFQAQQAMAHPVVYRCVNKIAEAVAGVEWHCRKKRGKWDPPDNKQDEVTKQIAAVLNQPCDDITVFNMKYWMAANYAVYGNIPIKVSRTWDGKANAFYPLRNVQTQVIGDTRGRIVRYKFASGDGPTFELPTRLAVEERERAGATKSKEAWAAVIAKAGLDILALDNSPTRAAILPVEVFTLLMHRARESAAGIPNKKYLIVADQPQTPDQEDELYNMMNESRVGGDRAGQIGFIYGQKADILTLDNDLSDIHGKVPLDDMARQIAGIWGVPAQLMGLGGPDAAKYALNYVEGRRAFYEDTVIPGYLEPIAAGMTAALCPPGYEIWWDIDSIEAVREARVSRMKDAAEIPFLTVNEVRFIFDYKPLPGGDIEQGKAYGPPKTPPKPDNPEPPPSA